MNALLNSGRLLPLLGVLLLLSTVGWYTKKIATNYVFDQVAQRGQTTLRLTVESLNGALGRYRSVPFLIADIKDVQKFLASSASLPLDNQINHKLKRINAAIRASDIYIMNDQGLTIAASNFDSNTSFVGRNFSFRPYFQDAIKGKQGRFFALGTTSSKRGYYFASPVYVNGAIKGVVAVKVSIDKIEAAWNISNHEIVVTDKLGIIFMASKPAWHFRSMIPLSDETKTALKSTRKYNEVLIQELAIVEEPDASSDHRMVNIATNTRPLEYLVQNVPMPVEAWNVHILSRTASARAQAYTIAAALLFTLISMILSATILLLRRRRLLERIDSQQEARLQLAKRVKERTYDLKIANSNLIEEISERKLAEEELKKTQADLIQASKLAALGQMSAALSHELNQPLGAAKSYADNAAVFLDRDRIDDARKNITSISTLIDRMASIGKHLRNFARKPHEQTSTVFLNNIINDALEILATRIKAIDAKISVELPREELWVVGGQVRLQQVLVNLIGNSLDAMENLPQPKVEIKAIRNNQYIILSVRDFGAGIEDEAASQIFDPFFTTKGVGKGLGLGLSISYNIVKDFGGELSARNHEDGGAEFVIKLNSQSVKSNETII
ncbi:MAG: sensor histidine kinase [bacterium]|nr:sensor histidine kinase [bacterium]